MVGRTRKSNLPSAIRVCKVIDLVPNHYGYTWCCHQTYLQYILTLVGVVWLNHFADYAFFYGVAALVLCYKSVKKVTFIGHPSVMTTVKNSPRIILMTK